jgi:hypothetical protein
LLTRPVGTGATTKEKNEEKTGGAGANLKSLEKVLRRGPGEKVKRGWKTGTRKGIRKRGIRKNMEKGWERV